MYLLRTLKLWKVSFISKILERYFAEMFYYCFIETFFIVYLWFCGDAGGTCVYFSAMFHFFPMFVFKCCTKLDRFKFVNHFVRKSESPV